jgi:DNA-binding XRE family transcriptional regulator
MARWKDIREDRVGNDPVREDRIRRERVLLDLEVALHQLRERRGLSQRALADIIGTSQPNISRIEHEDDLQISTLAGYISGMGGRLEVHAVFDDEDVRLTPA